MYVWGSVESQKRWRERGTGSDRKDGERERGGNGVGQGGIWGLTNALDREGKKIRG